MDQGLIFFNGRLYIPVVPSILANMLQVLLHAGPRCMEPPTFVYDTRHWCANEHPPWAQYGVYNHRGLHQQLGPIAHPRQQRLHRPMRRLRPTPPPA
jgi:hypothetical protein